MKRIMRRSYLVLLVALMFFAGIGYLAFRVVTQSSKWVQHPYNGHALSSSDLGNAGEITDRYGVQLAYNVDGTRKYHDDETTREALMHVIGDRSMNVSTSIQNMYRAELTGYNFVLGMGLPSSLKSNRDVRLTVDADACRAAYEAIGDRKGACVVYNYLTGEVLVSVSSSSYDPENPPTAEEIEANDWYDGVYLDNVVSSTYTPGSTFKIVTAVAAIENIPDIFTRTFKCDGEYYAGDYSEKPIKCSHVHDEINFEQAFAHSCNVVFGQLATEIGAEKMTETAERLGFNTEEIMMSGIPIAESHYYADGADENTLAWTGIGQGMEEYEDKANPLRTAMICAAIANDGVAVAPYIVEDDGSLMNKLGISDNQDHETRMMSSSTAKAMQRLMNAAAQYYEYPTDYGMHKVEFGGHAFYAKTGTAEREGKEDTGWFTGFIGDRNHPYAFAVVIEEGGMGQNCAAPVAEAAVMALINR